MFAKASGRIGRTLFRYALALATLIPPVLLSVALQRYRALAPIVSMSFLCAVAASGTWFGAGPGLFVSVSMFPILTLVATRGKSAIPAHWDFAALFVLFLIAVLSSRLRSAQLRARRILVDANERLEIEVQERTAELARARDWLRTTLKSIGDAVIATDASGKITFMNDVASNLTGWSEADACNRRLEEVFVIVNEETRREVESPVEKVLRLGTIAGLANHTILLARNGREIPIDDSGAPIRDENGDLTGVVLVFRDISERRAAEAERERLADEIHGAELRLREAAKLESLGILAGGIAHDFNNLLVGIIGASSLALDMLLESEPARSLVQETMRAGERAAALTNQMLAYSGKGKFVIEALDLGKTVADLLPLLTRSHPATPIECDAGRRLPAMDGDRSQIQQVAMNLILNAIEACASNGGRVRISTRVVDASNETIPPAFGLPARDKGRFVCLEVSDTGCGMPPETVAKIFDPFFTTKFTGRGLGLSAVLGIVRGHKGSIRVESEPGRGTTFRVYFPASEHSVPEDTDLKPLHEFNGSGRVLVVDDEDVILSVATATLERCGYSVVTARNGAEALQRFREHGEFDIILLDMTMPVMGGEAALAELSRAGLKSRVIVSSGFSAEEAAERFRGQPIDGFLQKPYTSSALAEKVNSLRNGSADQAGA